MTIDITAAVPQLTHHGGAGRRRRRRRRARHRQRRAGARRASPCSPSCARSPTPDCWASRCPSNTADPGCPRRRRSTCSAGCPAATAPSASCCCRTSSSPGRSPGSGQHDPAPRIYGDVLAGAQIGNATAERGTEHALDRRTTVTRACGRHVGARRHQVLRHRGARRDMDRGRRSDRRTGPARRPRVRPARPGRRHLEPRQVVGVRAARHRKRRGPRSTASSSTATLVIEEGSPPDPRRPGRRPCSAPSTRRCTPRSTSESPRAALEDGAEFVRTRSTAVEGGARRRRRARRTDGAARGPPIRGVHGAARTRSRHCWPRARRSSTRVTRRQELSRDTGRARPP